MFKRTAIVFALFMVPPFAAAQQPVVWPWLPMQVWAVPENGQAMPFPTPFWLWVVPPAQPSEPPPARAETPAPEPIPASPLAVMPAQTEAPPVPAPIVVEAVPAPIAVEPVAGTPQPASALAEAPVVAMPTPIRKAPVAKQKPKSVARTTTGKARKLCFKDGKLDVCAQ